MKLQLLVVHRLLKIDILKWLVETDSHQIDAFLSEWKANPDKKPLIVKELRPVRVSAQTVSGG